MASRATDHPRLRLWLALIAAFLATLAGFFSAGAPSASAANFTYDQPTLVPVEARSVGLEHEITSSLPGDARDVSALPAGRAPGTSASPALPRIATEAVVASVDDLTGSTLSNYNRFVKNLPAAAEQPTITSLPGGGFEFSANVPASNIPGSYATYAKVVDADGVTTSFIKTTIAPDGSVVSVKVKYP